MSTLGEIETAADALPPAQKQELLLFLAARLRAQAGDLPPPRKFGAAEIERTDLGIEMLARGRDIRWAVLDTGVAADHPRRQRDDRRDGQEEAQVVPVHWLQKCKFNWRILLIHMRYRKH